MKFERFFESFDVFAEAPGAVEKLRDAVLELAVTGKLVHVKPEDTEVFVKSLAAQRSALVEARKIKGRRGSPVSPDEKPFAVPLHWRWLRLYEVGYELGQAEPEQRFTYIDVGAIDSKKGEISASVGVLEPSDAPSRARKVVEKGTVIYSTVRPYLRNIAIVDRVYDPAPIASTAFGILYPFDGVNARYLFYWLRSRPFTDYAQEAMKGMAYPAINDEKFYNGYIPLPPLAEQKQIVAKVDELMVLCDRLEAQQAQARDLATRLLDAAVAELTRRG